MSTISDIRAQRPQKRRFGIGQALLPFALFLLVLALWGPSLFAEARLYAGQYGNGLFAFYLDNGNVFYGKVRGVGFDRVMLTDAYTFQSVSVGETSTSNLIPQAGNPLTMPHNWVVVEREHVLFYEQVGEDASLRKAIGQ